LLVACLPRSRAEPPPHTWSWEQIADAVHHVRAGRDLTPPAWPGNARVAVALSFDLDDESTSLRDGQTSPGELSRGQYGARAGLPRVLALLRRHQIPATFFVPAVIAGLEPAAMRAIVGAGHEVGVHGWIHERNSLLSEDEERELMGRAIATLERVTGRRPVGIRTPSWDFSPHTLALLREHGLSYDSSLMADDRPYEILAAGRPTGIVELPVEWILDDYPYFGFSRYEPIRPHIAPDDVLAIWKAEFDLAYTEGALFVLTMHPHIIGHRSRIGVLERLLEHMKARGGAWFATHEAVAAEAAKQLR
jgi:peptidoglycan/xylan/chitin deacetylase (PgdA/CDA1 family)